jgi:hypothetical protein
MLGELLLRFVLGGLFVSIFSLVGSSWKPKTFAGLFSAAPSVALASLGLTYGNKGPTHVALEARSMLVGCVAFIIYCGACIGVTHRRTIPVGAGVLVVWLVWLGVALSSYALLEQLGWSP